MKTPVYQEKTFGLYHQCYLWNVMQHHWSPSLFRVLSMLLILHCWLFASRQLFHVTGTPPWLIRSSRASTSSELYPDGFLLLAFAMTSLCFPFSFISFCFASFVDFLCLLTASTTGSRGRFLTIDVFYIVA